MQVFISHSRVNSSAAFRLSDELRKRGTETWLDLHDLEPGADWNESVAAAIDDAAGFVFLIGPPGPLDRWQTFEWQQVVDRELYLDASKPLIPVLIGNPDLPGFLKTRQTLNWDDSPQGVSAVVNIILKSLHDPATSIDEVKLELGRKARSQALRDFREYSEALQQEQVKRAAPDALK